MSDMKTINNNSNAELTTKIDLENCKMRIETVHGFDEFVKLESAWKMLEEESGSDNPFITYEFFYCLLKAFFEKSELLIFVVKDDEEVVGIAPFYRDTSSIRSISNIHSHYFDFIIKKNRSDVYAYVFQYIFKNYKFKNIFLGDVCSHSGLFDYVNTNDSFIHAVMKERYSPVLAIAHDWNDFYASVSRNFRNNVNKRINKINRQGGYLLKECTDTNKLDVFLNDLFNIEKKSWKHLLGKSMLRTDQQPMFYSLLSKEFFDNVKIEILYINDMAAAFWLSLFYKNSIYQLKNSFVEDIKEFSPGIILTVECLKKYFKQHVKSIDYLGVTNSVKSKVSNDARVACDVLLVKKNLVNYAYFILKFKLWPKMGNSIFAQNLKNYILRKSPKKTEEVSRKIFLKE